MAAPSSRSDGSSPLGASVGTSSANCRSSVAGRNVHCAGPGSIAPSMSTGRPTSSCWRTCSTARISPQRFPSELIARALATGRAVAFEDAWVDVCPARWRPCGGERADCPAQCDRSFGNALFAAARAAVFVSPLHRDIVASVLDCPLPDDVVLVRPMVDPDHFRPRDVERDIDVLYVGTIKEAKGYYELLERFGPDRLTFAGDNQLGHPIEGSFLGRVSQHDLPALYSRARIFAHLPRWHEPQGRTVVEAALCGCEIVTNDRVGVTRYPRAAWSDAETVRTHPARFWEEFERAVAATASA